MVLDDKDDVKSGSPVAERSRSSCAADAEEGFKAAAFKKGFEASDEAPKNGCRPGGTKGRERT